jgi:predicted transcriptional regulator
MSCKNCRQLVCECPSPKVVYSEGHTAKEMRVILNTFAAESTQRAMAEKMGVSESYLSDVLRGRREPTDRCLTAIGFEKVTFYRPIAKKGQP